MSVFKYKSSPAIRQYLTTQKIMDRLTLALIIVYLFGLANASRYGTMYVSHALAMLFVALIGGVGTELVYARVMKKDPIEYIRNSYPWVTCLIMVEILPCDTSLYAILVSSILALFFGKLAFGGFGRNIFNPAAVGRSIAASSFVGVSAVDLITSATPAQSLSSVSWLMTPETYELFLNNFGGLENLIFGNYHGALGETSIFVLAVLMVFLIFDRIIDWRASLSYLLICFLSALGVGLTHGLGFSYAVAFMCTGGIAYGAVFMLTDPVTTPVTAKGRLIFASVAALVTCLIRYFGNLPEGVCYGILIGNMLSPAIDRALSGKQLKNHTRDLLITLAIAASCVLIIVIAALSLENSVYVTRYVPHNAMFIDTIRSLVP